MDCEFVFEISNVFLLHDTAVHCSSQGCYVTVGHIPSHVTYVTLCVTRAPPCPFIRKLVLATTTYYRAVINMSSPNGKMDVDRERSPDRRSKSYA